MSTVRSRILQWMKFVVEKKIYGSNDFFIKLIWYKDF